MEYTPQYAQAVADMWNRSQESWGGGSRIRSADGVKRELQNAGNLMVFLAVDGEEVVGYCSFSQYQHDEGALYVPLLNVRPDYHGRKVGRDLILKAVETTVEMGWPRLDLFTWAGNTKAVPMYKKTGFFWEKKEDSVHLMNFIPAVLMTDALRPSLERLDWYADSKRKLDIRPDGRSENGFDYFEYAWEKDGTSLRVEFEKTGRGISLIETGEYAIHTEIDDHDLVFGSRYPVRYRIRNKTGEPLECTIRGRHDKTIQFALEQNVRVADTVVIEGEFELLPIQEDQSDWRTHPAVVSDWTINGRHAELRTGIAPKFPARVKLDVKNQEQYIGAGEEAFLTFENNFKEPAVFELEFPPSEFIQFENPCISIRIPAKGKAAVTVPYLLKDFGIFSENVVIKAIAEGSEPVSFTARIWGVFKGNTGRYGGDIVDHWVAVNGPYTMGLNKNNNELWTSHFQRSHHTSWTFPRIGKPFSPEFSKKKAEEVRFYPHGDAMVLEADYRSEDFPGMAFTAFSRLNASGIVERYFEVRNASVSVDSGGESLCLIDGFYHHSEGLVLPYDGRYYDLLDRFAAQYDDWDINRISENWLFSRNEKLSHGFCWEPSAKLVKMEWHFGVEYELGGLAAGETVRTASTFLAIGTFPDWWDFRSFARKRRDPVQPLLQDHLELSVNGGNPFIVQDADVNIKQHRNQPLAGEMTLSLPETAPEVFHKTFNRDDALHSAVFPLKSFVPGSIEPVRMRFETEELSIERGTVLIPVGLAPVQQEIRQGEGGPYRCSNGTLTIEASPAFGAGLHSLRHNGEEWLDSSYPEAGPRSWWNPWHGGISASVQGISPLSMQDESRSAAFASLTDNRGNEWSGIELHTHIEKHERYRGLELTLFALLLPGAPVLCCVTRLTNRTEMAHNSFQSTINSFLLPGESLEQGWMEKDNGTRYRCGKAGAEIESDGVIRLGSDNRSAALHALNRYPGSKAWMYTNNLVIHHRVSQSSLMPAESMVWAAPVFYTFAGTPLSYTDMRALAEITFGG